MNRHAAAWGVLACSIVVGLSPGGRSEADPPRGRDATVTLYDPSPDHPWNRLHRALFVRTARDGKELGHDALDPLLWPQSKHLLVGPSHKEAVARLDELLAPNGVEQVRDPLKRALLQRDLWAVFEWAADPYLSRYGSTRFGPGPEQVYPQGDHPAERKVLQRRLARAVGRLALTLDAVGRLPDNYAAAVKSKAFPAKFDPEHPDRPFLPDDLFDPNGPWVCVGGSPEGPPLALAHARFFAGRSAFVVFLNLPGGRKATLDYLATLDKAGPPLVTGERKLPDGTRVQFADVRPELPQFPVGTQVALLRRMLLPADDGQLADTPITESVQFRVHRRIRPGMFESHDVSKASQAFFEFELGRADLFAGKAGGLRPVPPDETVYLALQFLTGYNDPFEKPPEPRRSHLMPLHDTCAACHAGSGIYGVNSYTRKCSTRAGTRPDLAFRPGVAWEELERAVHWKREQYLWGLLRGLADR